MTPPPEGVAGRYDTRPGHRIQIMRFRRSHLQASVLHYRHPETDRRITVFGMHHFGPPEYFTEVWAWVEKIRADGGVVLGEGSSLFKLPTDTKTTCTPRERAALEEIATVDPETRNSLVPRSAGLIRTRSCHPKPTRIGSGPT